MSKIILHHIRSCHTLLIRIHRLSTDHVRTLHLHLLIEHHTLVALSLHVSKVLRSTLWVHCVLLGNRIHVHHRRASADLLWVLRNGILPELGGFRLLNHASKFIHVTVLIIGNKSVVRFLIGHVQQDQNFHVALSWCKVHTTCVAIRHNF